MLRWWKAVWTLSSANHLTVTPPCRVSQHDAQATEGGSTLGRGSSSNTYPTAQTLGNQRSRDFRWCLRSCWILHRRQCVELEGPCISPLITFTKQPEINTIIKKKWSSYEAFSEQQFEYLGNERMNEFKKINHERKKYDHEAIHQTAVCQFSTPSSLICSSQAFWSMHLLSSTITLEQSTLLSPALVFHSNI